MIKKSDDALDKVVDHLKKFTTDMSDKLKKGELGLDKGAKKDDKKPEAKPPADKKDDKKPEAKPAADAKKDDPSKPSMGPPPAAA